MAALGLAAYVLGSIPFGWLAGKLHGVDIRSVGSGNIGATNVSRNLGRPWGVLVFLLDTLKGLGPTLAASMVLSGPPARADLSQTGHNLCLLAVGISAVLGHNYSVFLRFRGGKGVATTLGVALGVYPALTYAALAALAVWLAVTLTSRYVALGSICAAVAFPFALILISGWQEGFLKNDWPLLVFSSLLAGLVIHRHRANILRLATGTEGKIGKMRRVD